jgi:hypothetical protein
MVMPHKEDVFEAIKMSLLENDNNLNYSKLYKKVNEKLKILREKSKVTLSTRDFDSEINVLLNEGLLIRRQDDKSKNKIKPVYFSLSKKAIKQHQFGVLGISREKENLRKLYHLLFFYQVFNPMRRISKKQLDEILSRISVSEKDLVVDTHSHTVGTNFTQTIYKPVKYIQIQKTELSDLGPSKRETAAFYSCRFLSFSEEEIKEYLEKSNNDILVPYVNSIDFRKEEIEKQFRRAFGNLRDTRLISLIKDIFLGKTRYIFSDESLRDLISKIWNIHEYQLAILRNKMVCEAPDEIEKLFLERIFGKDEAGKIIGAANLKRQSISREDQKVKEARDDIENDNKIVEGIKRHVTNKYKKVIQEYDFPIDLIEGVTLGKVFY